MTVNVLVKWAAVRYGAIAVVATALLVGCVWGSAFVWQKIDNRGRDAEQQRIDETYLHPAQEAHKRGDHGAYERLMEQYQRANERNSYSR